MLFAVKRDAGRSVALAAALAVVAVVSRRILGLTWTDYVDARLLVPIGGGLVAILLSDALVHGVLALVRGEAYLDAFDGLVEYFQGHSRWAILTGGLLAAAEELLFRGVVLLGLVQLASTPPTVAVLLAALSFGAAHYIPERRLRPMAIWAVLEGVILGGLLVVTGSLLVPVVAHALHDVLGFSLFAWLRREGTSRN